jgi:hypothetical protein
LKAKVFNLFYFVRLMWKASTKTDLVIEVWEKLDCESIGATEIEAIETVVRDVYGKSAVDSPMTIARLLADEGAELRHSEIMELYVERASDRPYGAALRNILKLDDLQSTLGTVRALETLRKKYLASADKEGLRKLRETAISGKDRALETAGRKNVDPETRYLNSEIANWLTIWLQTPDVFEDWVKLRQKSTEFVDLFVKLD